MTKAIRLIAALLAAACMLACAQGAPGASLQERLLTQVAPTLLASDADKTTIVGQQARYLLLDEHAGLNEALRRFAQGEGIPYPTDSIPYLTSADLARRHQAVFTLAAIRSPLPRLTYSIICLQIGRATTWTLGRDERPTQVSDVGADLPDGPAGRPTPTVMLSLPSDETTVVVTRMVSPTAVIPFAVLYGQTAYTQRVERMQRSSGLVFGAAIAALLVAFAGAVRRRSADHGIYFAAMLMLGAWQAVKFSPSNVVDLPELKRFIIPGPPFLYFLATILSLWRLLREPRLPNDEEAAAPIAAPVRWLLITALPLNLLGLAISIGYALWGQASPGATYQEEALNLASGLTPLLTFAAVAASRWRTLPGGRSLFIGQAIALLGFVLYLLREYTRWIDSPPWGLVTALSLPAEALLWAVALAERFKYLDLFAKNRTMDMLMQEEARIRGEMALSNASRDRAMRELDSSYQYLGATHSAVIGILDSATHELKGAVEKLDITLGRAATAGNTASIQHARLLLANLGEDVGKISEAATHAIEKPTPQHNVEDYLQWHIALHESEWRRRSIALQLDIDPQVAQIQVDALAFALATKELLQNVSRYALPDSRVDVQMRVKQVSLELSVENDARIDAERMHRLFDERLGPASETLNDETSSGSGLYALRVMLSSRRGRVHAELTDAGRFRATARFLIIR